MQWELKWGSEYAMLLEIQRETGLTPRALMERPKPAAKHRPVLEAFYAVSAGRGYSMAGVQPLQAAEISAYFEIAGIDDPDERVRLFGLFRRLDSIFLTHMAERSKAAEARPRP